MIKGWLVWLVAGLVLGNLYPLMERYCRKWWVKGLFWLGVWFLEAEARRHPRVDVYPAVNAAISRGARI